MLGQHDWQQPLLSKQSPAFLPYQEPRQSGRCRGMKIIKISSGCGTIYRCWILDLLVVTGCHEFDLFSHMNWEFHHPNWRTHIFQRGGYTTTNQLEGCGNLVFYFTTWIMINIHNRFCCVNCCSFHLEWQKIRKIKQSFYGHPKSSDVNICKYD